MSKETFLSFSLGWLNRNRDSLSRESYYTYKSFITKIHDFKQNVTFDDLSEEFIHSYKKWMSEVRGNNENTVSKSLRVFRTFCNLAVRYEKISKNPFQYVRIKKVSGKREFLTKEEFEMLYIKFLENKFSGMHAEALRSFLFSCLTGLRYTDLKNLKEEQIIDEKIKIVMHKTSLPVVVPLSEKAKVILKSRDHFLVMYCNKVINRKLKEVITACGIEKRVTFHVARHTFATICITLGIPIEVTSKLLGHTDIKTTQVYAKVVDSVKEREMRKWDF